MNSVNVVYVEKEKFLREMMEKALVGADFRLYTYADKDCLHFIEDLKPSALILDVATVDEDFAMQIDAEIPMVFTGSPEQLNNFSFEIQNRLEKPLGPFDLVAYISKIIS